MALKNTDYLDEWETDYCKTHGHTTPEQYAASELINLQRTALDKTLYSPAKIPVIKPERIDALTHSELLDEHTGPLSGKVVTGGRHRV